MYSNIGINEFWQEVYKYSVFYNQLLFLSLPKYARENKDMWKMMICFYVIAVAVSVLLFVERPCKQLVSQNKNYADTSDRDWYYHPCCPVSSCSSLVDHSEFDVDHSRPENSPYTLCERRDDNDRN